MENLVTHIRKRYRQSIRFWWTNALLGVLLFGMGVVVFMHPAESYLTLAIMFGVLMLLSGIMQLWLALTLPKDSGRGWMLVSGVIEIVIGVILCLNTAVSAQILVLFLGFWLLFRSLSLIGVASDMQGMGVKGAVWVVLWGIVLMLCAFMVLVFPLFGIGLVVVWLGVSFMVTGVAMISLAFQLRSLKEK